jgi:hypothetical protein
MTKQQARADWKNIEIHHIVLKRNLANHNYNNNKTLVKYWTTVVLEAERQARAAYRLYQSIADAERDSNV